MSTTYLTTREAAAFLRCSPRTLCRLRKESRLPHYRLAWKYLYCRADLERWMEAQRIGGGPWGARG